MDIRDVHGQPWSGLLNIFYICTGCNHVTGQGVQMGYVCRICGAQSGVRLFYTGVISSLIDGVQACYQSNRPIRGAEGIQDTNPYTVIPILFCTMAEVCMESFLRSLCRKQGTPEKLTSKLLRDNQSWPKRKDDLFPMLTDLKWSTVLEELSSGSAHDFKHAFVEHLGVIKARNKFIHSGAPWAITSEHSEGCIDRIWTFLHLFVGLNNRFICTSGKG